VPGSVKGFWTEQLFLNAYAEGEPLADVTMDGVVDADDVQTFLDAYANATP
jgi:hypothetical protein